LNNIIIHPSFSLMLCIWLISLQPFSILGDSGAHHASAPARAEELGIWRQHHLITQAMPSICALQYNEFIHNEMTKTAVKTSSFCFFIKLCPHMLYFSELLGAETWRMVPSISETSMLKIMHPRQHSRGSASASFHID
jgi:hypothetical protein